MSSFCKVILVGRVGKDPEVKNFDNGGKLVNLSVATSQRWTDKKSGEKKERTEWHRVVVRNDATAGFVEKYVKKGNLVCVEGELQTRKWQDQSGNDKYATEIVIAPFGGSLSLLSSKGDGGQSDAAEDDEPRGKAAAKKPIDYGKQLDDEIPF